jgi:hypothetical protein
MSLTKERLDEALKSDAIKAVIKSAVDDEVKGLKEKRDELLGSVRELKDKLSAIESEKAEAEEKAAANSGDIEKIKQQLETKHQKEIEKLNATVVKLNGQLETHVIGEGLTQALVKSKVAPGLMEAAKALIKQTYKGEVGDNDGKPFAKFDGKSVDEFVTVWVQSEHGKHFVSAQNNSGGGANGANGNGKAGTGNTTKKTMTRAEFDALPAMEKVKVSKDGVALVDA